MKSNTCFNSLRDQLSNILTNFSLNEKADMQLDLNTETSSVQWHRKTLHCNAIIRM